MKIACLLAMCPPFSEASVDPLARQIYEAVHGVKAVVEWKDLHLDKMRTRISCRLVSRYYILWLRGA